MVQPQPQASQLFPNGLHNLLSVLFEEEREAYSAAIGSAADRFALHHVLKVSCNDFGIAVHYLLTASLNPASRLKRNRRAVFFTSSPEVKLLASKSEEGMKT